MTGTEYAQKQIAFVRRFIETTLEGTTDEQLNWIPPGDATPIKSSLLHVFGAEDRFFQEGIHGGTTLWEREDWPSKLGVPYAPGRSRGWDEAYATPLALAPILAYGEAVRAATDAYLATLTGEELERTVTMFGRERQVADVLVLFVCHTAGHMGEIAALKGAQGGKGFPA